MYTYSIAFPLFGLLFLTYIGSGVAGRVERVALNYVLQQREKERGPSRI